MILEQTNTFVGINAGNFTMSGSATIPLLGIVH